LVEETIGSWCTLTDRFAPFSSGNNILLANDWPLKAASFKQSDFMPARDSPSGFAAPYNFSISPPCGFAFRHIAGTCFHELISTHLALKGLENTVYVSTYSSQNIAQYEYRLSILIY